MCEFKVYLREGSNGERMVAEEIVRIERKGDKLILSDILGASKALYGFIDEVDVSKEYISISNDPFLAKMAELLGIYFDYLKGGGKDRLEKAVRAICDASQRLLDEVKGL
ncbi:MAG: CooT family nickel-binding protein [Candidatus Bathyarchaeia archaeon]